MGITYVEGTVRGEDRRESPVSLLVDSGTRYAVLPLPVWNDRGISEWYITLPHRESHTPVILGEPGDEALLGVVTLEIMGLDFNAFNRTLQQMRIHLA